MAELAPHLFQPGNQLGKRVKYVHGAIQRAVIQDDGAKLRKMVETMLDLACSGDVQAANWVRDTLDGKPAQSVTVSGDEDKPLISLVKMVVVQATQDGEQMRVVQDVPPVIEAQQAERLPDSQPATPMAEPVGEVSNSDTHLT